VRWPRNRYSSSRAEIFVQNSKMDSIEASVEAIERVVHDAMLVTKLSINVEVSDTETVEALLEKLITMKNIRLEQLFIRRRYVGQRFTNLPALIRHHSSTLRMLGKIGISEALASFTPQLHLSRLSLINFDLIDDGQMESAELEEQTRFCWRRLGGLGATFTHLSYTTFSGFQLTRNPFIHTLRNCKVTSFRLTMQKGEALPMPSVLHSLLPQLKRLELVGSMGVDCSHVSVYFPQLESFNMERVDLVLGGSNNGKNNNSGSSQAIAVPGGLSVLATDPRHSSFTERAIGEKHGSVAIGAAAPSQ